MPYNVWTVFTSIRRHFTMEPYFSNTKQYSGAYYGRLVTFEEIENLVYVQELHKFGKARLEKKEEPPEKKEKPLSEETMTALYQRGVAAEDKGVYYLTPEALVAIEAWAQFYVPPSENKPVVTPAPQSHAFDCGGCWIL